MRRDTIVLLAASLSLPASLMGCSTPYPVVGVCDRVEVPLEPDAKSAFGFSGSDALAMFGTERNEWEVDWSGETDPSVDVFAVTAGDLIDVKEVYQVAVDDVTQTGSFCDEIPRVMQVETTLALISADRGVQGNGLATLQFQSLTDDPVEMFFEWDDVTLSVTRQSGIAASLAADRPGAQIDRIALEANGASIGLAAWWSEPDGQWGSSAPFQCSWNLYACMEMSASAAQ